LSIAWYTHSHVDFGASIVVLVVPPPTDTLLVQASTKFRRAAEP
jgi:hypothetical protein